MYEIDEYCCCCCVARLFQKNWKDMNFLYLNQVDTERNFLVVDSGTNRLLIAHADQPRSQWRVAHLAGFPGKIRFWGAVWFRNRLYVAGRNGELLTFAPVDGSRSGSTAHAQT